MISLPRVIVVVLAAACLLSTCSSFQVARTRMSTVSRQQTPLFSKDDEMSNVDEYRNGVTEFLSNFMQRTPEEADETVDPLGDIDFGAPKVAKMSLEKLAATLDAELYEKEWFVTGNVNPIYFDDNFQFQDPDVKLTGIEDYARGVKKLFRQDSRAEIISCVVNTTTPNTITITWRLSGGVNIGPGLDIKPYICYTDFTVDENSGLVVFQEDRFDIPGWDILLSALFPFLIGKITAPPAPAVEPRVVKMPIEEKKLFGIF